MNFEVHSCSSISLSKSASVRYVTGLMVRKVFEGAFKEAFVGAFVGAFGGSFWGFL